MDKALVTGRHPNFLKTLRLRTPSYAVGLGSVSAKGTRLRIHIQQWKCQPLTGDSQHAQVTSQPNRTVTVYGDVTSLPTGDVTPSGDATAACCYPVPPKGTLTASHGEARLRPSSPYYSTSSFVLERELKPVTHRLGLGQAAQSLNGLRNKCQRPRRLWVLPETGGDSLRQVVTEPSTATNKRKDTPKSCTVTSVIREGAAKPRSAGFTGPCRPSACPVWELLKRRALGPPTPSAASQGDLWPCLPGPCPGAPRPRHGSQAGLKPRNGPSSWAFHQARGPPGTLSMRAWASLMVMEGVQKSMLTTWPE